MKAMSPLEELRHSCSHVLATAVLRLHPETQLDIGPPTDNGFYYDIDLDKKLDAADLEAIEAEMKKVIKENQKFTRIECSREEAVEKIKSPAGALQTGRLDDILEVIVSFYQNGEFIDLAPDPMSATQKKSKLSNSSPSPVPTIAETRTTSSSSALRTAFPNKEELAEYLERMWSGARDHRKLGKELKPFHIDEAVGSGMVLWTPTGLFSTELQNFSDELSKTDTIKSTRPIGKLGLPHLRYFPYYGNPSSPRRRTRHGRRTAQQGCSCADLQPADSGEIDGYLLKPMNARCTSRSSTASRTPTATSPFDSLNWHCYRWGNPANSMASPASADSPRRRSPLLYRRPDRR